MTCAVCSPPMGPRVNIVVLYANQISNKTKMKQPSALLDVCNCVSSPWQPPPPPHLLTLWGNDVRSWLSVSNRSMLVASALAHFAFASQNIHAPNGISFTAANSLSLVLPSLAGLRPEFTWCTRNSFVCVLERK